jgi:hypothetical protein
MAGSADARRRPRQVDHSQEILVRKNLRRVM